MNKKICLNMIVKNEAHIIARCLYSIKDWVDAWVIADTGSKDGTQELIRELMQDIPGELIESPWVNFSYNRNQVLEIAKNKADYSLFIDADQVFVPADGLRNIMSNIDDSCDGYDIQVREGNLFAVSHFLLNNKSLSKWTGVIHEHLVTSNNDNLKMKLFQNGIINASFRDGARSLNPNKFYKDALILEKALEKEPNNSRYLFYLGRSYMNAGHFQQALDVLTKRANILKGSDPNETYFSLFLIGLIKNTLGFDEDDYLESFKKANAFQPSRHEPIYEIGNIYIKRKEFEEAYWLLKEHVFVYNLLDQYIFKKDVQDFLLPILFAIAAFETQRYQECLSTLTKILSCRTLPSNTAEKIKNDINFLKTQIPYLI